MFGWLYSVWMNSVGYVWLGLAQKVYADGKAEWRNNFAGWMIGYKKFQTETCDHE